MAKVTAEDVARELEWRLCLEHVLVRVENRGIHWRVFASAGSRMCQTSCAVLPDGTPEHITSFRETGRDPEQVAEGRTPDVAEAVASILDWLGGCTLQELYSHVHVDRLLRTYRRWREYLEGQLGRHDVHLQKKPVKLFVLGEERACHVIPIDDDRAKVELRLELDRVVSFEGAPDRVGVVIADWMSGVSLDELETEHPEASIGAHARLRERGDVAGWQWAHMPRQRAARR